MRTAATVSPTYKHLIQLSVLQSSHRHKIRPTLYCIGELQFGDFYQSEFIISSYEDSSLIRCYAVYTRKLLLQIHKFIFEFQTRVVPYWAYMDKNITQTTLRLNPLYEM
jgi:hypothetical protein